MNVYLKKTKNKQNQSIPQQRLLQHSRSSLQARCHYAIRLPASPSMTYSCEHEELSEARFHFALIPSSPSACDSQARRRLELSAFCTKPFSKGIKDSVLCARADLQHSRRQISRKASWRMSMQCLFKTYHTHTHCSQVSL